MSAAGSRTRSAAALAMLPAAAVAWVVVPRLVVNRAHYGLWELVMLASAFVAVPGTYALFGLVRGEPTSQSHRVQRWLWATVVSLVAFVVVLSVTGPRCCYPDDRIPGLTAGLLAGALAVVLTLMGVVVAVASRLSRRRARGS